MLTDIQIAQGAPLLPIAKIAARAGIPEEYLIPYGRFKAKVDSRLMETLQNKQDGKLILVSAINPTPAGEGKTTVSIGLADGLRRIGKNAAAALREPSLGPVFGVKGGATGGGYAQVAPMEDINLHFTGDIHAVTAANNLLAAMLDNHIHHGNELNIDIRSISWKRCMDMNDRQLRHIVSGLDGQQGGVAREDGFLITAASEVMAVLCLAKDRGDLKRRLCRIVVARDGRGLPVTAGMLGAHGAMAALLNEAFDPNLAQTLEGTPVLIHGGPFANIAHGCNSVNATQMALKLADYVVTEAGFGADLGAEKFIDIKCRAGGITPGAVVLVATARALKAHGGLKAGELGKENLPALIAGYANLDKHIQNIREVFRLPVVVAINRFSSDTQAELDWLKERVSCPYALCEAWGRGGAGALKLAAAVVEACAGVAQPSFAYPLEEGYEKKISAIAKKIYGAQKVAFAPGVKTALKRFEEQGFGGLPVCVAKTQYSLSDQPRLIGRPEGFEMTVREVKLSAGAGFIVAFTGEIIAMPGLPKKPAAQEITVEDSGRISGLF